MLQCQDTLKQNFMKIEFENSVRRLNFMCRLPDIKIAWINPWLYLTDVQKVFLPTWSKIGIHQKNNVNQKQ